MILAPEVVHEASDNTFASYPKLFGSWPTKTTRVPHADASGARSEAICIAFFHAHPIERHVEEGKLLKVLAPEVVHEKRAMASIFSLKHRRCTATSLLPALHFGYMTNPVPNISWVPSGRPTCMCVSRPRSCVGTEDVDSLPLSGLRLYVDYDQSPGLHRSLGLVAVTSDRRWPSPPLAHNSILCV